MCVCVVGRVSECVRVFFFFFTEGTLYLRTGRVRPRTDCLAREKDISDINIKGGREGKEKGVERSKV